jgi:hypothetical protein
LLSVGRSIFGTRETAAYRLNRRASLPRFNDGRNPFAPPAPPAPAAPAAPAAPKNEEAAVRVNASVPKAPPPYAFKPARPEKRPATPPPANPAPVSAAPAKRAGWTARLNPFRVPEPEAAPGPAAVQPELSLNSVKVVHNDLADADVEVVPVKSHSEAVSSPVLPPARRAWEYLGESLSKS